MNLFKYFSKINFKKYKKFLRSDWNFKDKKNDAFTETIRNFIKKNVALNKNAPIVIIWEMGGFESILRKNAIISLALNLRGYQTKFIVCDGVCKGCIQREIYKENICDWSKSCSNCLDSMYRSAEKYCIDLLRNSEFIDKKNLNKLYEISQDIEINDIKNFEYLGINVGQSALSSFIRYKKGYPTDLIFKEDDFVYRQYFYASLVFTYISNLLIQKFKPIGIFTSHGMYSDYEPAMFVGVDKNINVVSWTSGFFDFCHYFSFPESKHNLMPRRILNSEWDKIKSEKLSKKQEYVLSNFFSDRYVNQTTSDTCNFFDKSFGVDSLKAKLGITNKNPIVCLFAHLNWDACIDFSSMVFNDSYDWVIKSIKKMTDIKDVNWLIKIHPAEVMAGNYYGVLDEIQRKIKTIPEHIKIISPDLRINSYDLYNLINVGITIMGTVGVELSSLGKQVITAGRFHFANKGFTFDAKDKDEYFNLLENIKNLKPLTKDQINIARRYAYSYFVERQIPLNAINRKQGHWGDIDLKKLDLLLPGNDPVLDKICDAIVKGTDVILDEECIKFLEKINQQ